jgi:hypothetical protein
MQHGVDPPVPGLGEPKPELGAGGGLERGGAVPGREAVPAGEAGHAVDIDQQPGRQRPTDTVSAFHRPRPVRPPPAHAAEQRPLPMSVPPSSRRAIVSVNVTEQDCPPG